MDDTVRSFEKGDWMAVPTLADSRISLLSPLVAVTAPCESGGVTEVAQRAGTDEQWNRILNELLRLRGLENDWDGQGILALACENVDAALRWMTEMRRWRQALPPCCAVPGTAGEVVFEWRGDAFQLAAEISNSEKIEWLLNIPDQPLKQWETDARCTWIVRSER